MKELPNNLDSKRHRVAYRGKDKIYISVSFLDGKPVEVFSSFDEVHNNESFFMHSAWNGLTRLASLGLQSEDVGLDEVIKQLERSSISTKDACGVLLSVLKKYTDEKKS